MLLKVKRLHPGVELPSYAHDGDSGMDVKAYAYQVPQVPTPIFLGEPIEYGNSLWTPELEVAPGERVMIHTGLQVREIPEGHEIQVRPKSGNAWNSGITILNTPGTVDNSYRGELCVILINTSNEPFFIKRGQKVAQIVVAPIATVEVVDADGEEVETSRGADGFGSTGI